jgi:uroporphyrinogen-III synthase
MKNGKLNFPIYLLTNERYEGVLNYPVIKINFLSPSISFEGIDFLLFTSKNGVRAVDNINKKWKNYPCFAIGKATAKEIEKRGGKLEYIAKSSYGDEFAEEINEKYSNKTFLFLRAKKIISDIKNKFINNTLKEIIVYETICNNPETDLKKPAIVIFSSPSTVECFKKVNDFENVLPIAIGKKTKKALEEYLPANFILMPKKPSIKECIEIAKSIKLR